MLSFDENRNIRNQLRIISSQLRAIEVVNTHVRNLGISFKKEGEIQVILQHAENEAMGRLVKLLPVQDLPAD